MSLTRWQPFREMMTLRDTVDRLFDDPFFRQPVASLAAGTTTLPMDIVERDTELIVRASVPGFDADNIEVSIQGDVLTLRGSIEHSNGQPNGSADETAGNYYLREQWMKNFQRSVRLPVSVNSDEATAECKNGILTLHLPKSEEGSIKRIAVHSNGNASHKQLDVAKNSTEQGQR